MDQFPTLTKISEDIYHLVVRYPFGMFEMNSFLFKGDHGFTVVDTGSEAKESIEIWEKTISSGMKIEKLVLTHAHPDHIGLARWFQENLHVPVFISRLGYKEIQNKRKNEVTNWMLHFLKSHDCPEFQPNMGNSEAAAFEFEPDGLFEDQQNIMLGNENYETIWTPGHSFDHFCFYNQKQQVMLTGDHVLAGFSPIVALWSENDENPIKDNFASLEKLKAYSTRIALPGHGELIYNLNDRIEDMIKSHTMRLHQIIHMIGDKEKTSWQVCQEIYGTLGYPKFFAPLLATIARLVYLEKSGQVKCELQDGKWYFKALEKV
jgi:glyoxylase-like metal-dependent hydrolase (beta-lactamase superfamily II)